MKWIMGLLTLGLGTYALFGTVTASSYETPEPARIEVPAPSATALPRESEARVRPAVFRVEANGAGTPADSLPANLFQQVETELEPEMFSRRGPSHHKKLKVTAKSIN